MTNKKFSIFISIIGILIFVVAISSVSFAFYTANIENKGDNKLEASTAKLNTKFIDTETISIENMIPGDQFDKNFSIENTGGTVQFKIVVEDLTNTFTKFEDIRFVLKENDNIVKEGIFPQSALNNDLSNALSIQSGETKSYTLTIIYKNTEEDQAEDMGKTLSGKIYLKAI